MVLVWVAAAALVLLAGGGAWLAVDHSASLAHVVHALVHPAVGLAALAAGVWAGGRAWRRGWRPDLLDGVLGAVAVLGGALAVVAFVKGGASPHRAWMDAHVFSAVAATAALGVGMARRRAAGRALGSAAAGGIVLAAAGAAAWWGVAENARASRLIRALPAVGEAVAAAPGDTISNSTRGAASMEEEGDGPEGPFWPSAVSTSTGGIVDGDFFMEPERCAGSGCHSDLVAQWRSSAHHFSSFNNPWYSRSIEDMQDKVGTQPSKWCGGCHDHAVLFAGEMDRPIREQLHTPNAQAGLTCNSCHAIAAVRSTLGNGDFVMEYPALHKLVVSELPFVKALHDLVVKLDPEPHRRQFIKPFFTEQSGEYCSACHKVHLDKPVNQYRWLRGFNDYDAWQASGVSGQGARSFYYPKAPMTCRDCHMPLVPSEDAGADPATGLIRSHRFPGANTALPFHNGDAEQLATVTAFLQANQISVDVFALARTAAGAGDDGAGGDADGDLGDPAGAPAGRTVGDRPVEGAGGATAPAAASSFAEGDSMGFAEAGPGGAVATRVADVTAPLNRAGAAVLPGEEVRLDVVVRTRGVGHFFPGGTVDGFDVWVELRVDDADGRPVFHSGAVPVDERGRKGPVDPAAHFYRSLLIDEDGAPINKRNAWQARAVVYVRLIPPGAADTVHFRLRVPDDAKGPLTVTARVNHRKFAHFLTQHTFERLPGEPPDLPITVMAQAQAALDVLPPGSAPPAPAQPLSAEDRERWNDYGIGLLLQGDLRGAEAAFQRVTRIDPAWPSGWVNIGRARVSEGRTAEGEEVLDRALELAPALAAAHFFKGLARKDVGDYDGALRHFAAVDAQYPRDRVNLNETAHVHFLRRDFGEAVATLLRVLAIDPEDVRARYTLMLSRRGLGDHEQAAQEQALYLRFKADEDAQTRTGPYRLAHPHDNNERQAIHEHGANDGARPAGAKVWSPD